MFALSARRAALRWRSLSSKPPSARRCFTTDEETKHALRALLRETAQPVAVVTSFYPVDGVNGDTHPRFHGATLSSFSSIALDPHPLVAFSLKIPSRMANSLKSMMAQSSAEKPTLVVNLLSSTQEDAAVVFARPDLHPEPFRTVPSTLTEEGLPMLSGSLGALSCSVLSCIPLQALGDTSKEHVEPTGLVSELFISRVLRVESLSESRLPLLYHRRQYVTAMPCLSSVEDAL